MVKIQCTHCNFIDSIAAWRLDKGVNIREVSCPKCHRCTFEFGCDPSKPVVHQPAFSTTQCAICVSDLERCDDVSVLFCGHRFHDKCIDEWLKMNESCPTCRHYHPADISNAEVQQIRNRVDREAVLPRYEYKRCMHCGSNRIQQAFNPRCVECGRTRDDEALLVWRFGF